MDKFESYLSVERQLARDTVINYLYFINHFKKFLFPKDMNQAAREDITSFLSQLQNRGLVKSSIGLYVVALRNYFKWAYYTYRTDSLAQVDFFLRNIIKTKRDSKIPVIPTKEEVLKLRSVLSQFLQLNSWNKNCRPYKDTLRAFAMIELFITAGLRSKELKGLLRKDVDLDKRIIFVRQGKGDFQRISLFGNSAVEVLKEYFALCNFAPDEIIFPMAQQNVINRTIKLWAAKAQINPSIHAHSFRHYFITESRRQGIDIQIVADQVGHRDLNTTKHYTHFDIDYIRDSYRQIKI